MTQGANTHTYFLGIYDNSGLCLDHNMGVLFFCSKTEVRCKYVCSEVNPVVVFVSFGRRPAKIAPEVCINYLVASVLSPQVVTGCRRANEHTS